MKAQKFRFDCVEFENSYILMINVISFKLRMINSVYNFRHAVLVTSILLERLMISQAVISQRAYTNYNRQSRKKWRTWKV